MKIENDLGRDDIRRLVLRLAIPSMLAQFINVLYSVVDRIYIGNIPVIGETALAGVGVSGPIVTLISAFAYLVGLGGSPLMSIRMGEGQDEKAKKILANSFWMIVGLSAVLTLVLFVFKREILTCLVRVRRFCRMRNRTLRSICWERSLRCFRSE